MASPRPTRPTRVFIDSSVLFAAALSDRGPARELIVRGLQGDLHLFISSLVLEETERNLLEKAPRALGPFGLLREALGAGVVDPSRASVIRVAKVVNLKDAPIVSAALKARAFYLATHDVRTLLRYAAEIRENFGVQLVQPQEVLETLRDPR